jgi:hypothetical protein
MPTTLPQSKNPCQISPMQMSLKKLQLQHVLLRLVEFLRLHQREPDVRTARRTIPKTSPARDRAVAGRHLPINRFWITRPLA